MNTNPTEQNMSVTFSGQIHLSNDVLSRIIREALPKEIQPVVPVALQVEPKTLPRMAYSLHETAEMLGVCDKTIYRLIARGLIKSSLACRHKIIAKSEIERFLKETSKSV